MANWVYARIQDGRYPLPTRSRNWWAGTEDDWMPGVSAFSNEVSAISDLLFGERDEGGTNYAACIEDEGGEPVLCLIVGREEPKGDDLGVVLSEARELARFTKDEVRQAVVALHGEDLWKADYPEDGIEGPEVLQFLAPDLVTVDMGPTGLTVAVTKDEH